METIMMDDLKFEVIDFVPAGYEIWNIGRHMVEGFLPLCRLSFFQSFPGARQVDTDSLKAIKTEGAQIILQAVGHGQNTLKKMEDYLKRYGAAKSGTSNYYQVERIKKALPYMRQIKWA